METREELLRKLGEAVQVLGQYANAAERLRDIRSQMTNVKPVKKFGTLSKVILGFWIFVFGCVYLITATYDLSIPVLTMIGWIIFLYVVLQLINVIKNKQVKAKNEQIMANNQWLSNQEKEVLQEIKQIQNVYNQNIAPWYPEKYSYLDAAQFFYEGVQNYRAESMKEMINLYEMTMHQKRMEDNQREAIKQQKIGNFIGAATAIGQFTTANAINDQTNSMNNNANMINDTLKSFRR